MSHYVLKIVITTALVVLISEVSRRSSLAGAVIASVPLISVLAMVCLYVETQDAHKVASLAKNIFWLVLPSLALFLLLPSMLERGYNFYVSLSASIGAIIVLYFLTITIVRRVGLDA